ncbi:LysR family transcriptional regulator [Roseateles sp.]|uniref:LysR family transcriptional regulator n=1 Tax=Roseateles sp. TaxID=1971397 RepID=UPI0025E31ABB|nr:LysR family transcriptional regulator [Roseateles sp.]MBV8037697.1 LysR family transcriptional regulator [Roseateles sp.]
MQRQFDDILLGSIELFCLAAEAGSFTAAASTAGVTPAAVSRSIARLEKRLGVRLFVRSTRSIRLTEGGREYFEHCRTALHQLAEAERRVSGEQVQPSGTIRVSAPTTYGHHRLLPLLPAFRERYPLIRVEAHISNRNIDMHEENFDVAIRFRAQRDSTMVARPLGDAELVVVAGPEYLRRAGQPRTLADLEQHECIQYTLPSSGRQIPWLFRQDGHEKEMLLSGHYICSEDVLAGVTLARAGAGLFQTYRFVAEQDLAAGRLVEVLQPFAGRSRPVSLIYPHGRLLPSRVRVFVEFMLEHSHLPALSTQASQPEGG